MQAIIFRYGDATGEHLTEGSPAFINVTNGSFVQLQLTLQSEYTGIGATALLTVFTED
jgi:hypothetical protein